VPELSVSANCVGINLWRVSTDGCACPSHGVLWLVIFNHVLFGRWLPGDSSEGVKRGLSYVHLRALVPGGVLLFGSNDHPENPGT